MIDKLSNKPPVVFSAGLKNGDKGTFKYDREYFGREKFIKVKEGTKVIAGGVFRSSEELEKVEFPKSLEYIGYSSFANCENLKQIIFEEDCNLTVIDIEAFEDCVSLESPVLPVKLKKINYMAFCRCKKIEEMNFPESVEYISNYALSGCVELKIIKVPKKMEGKYEFETVSIYEINPKIIFY